MLLLNIYAVNVQKYIDAQIEDFFEYYEYGSDSSPLREDRIMSILNSVGDNGMLSRNNVGELANNEWDIYDWGYRNFFNDLYSNFEELAEEY